jgi:hypothetical protein
MKTSHLHAWAPALFAALTVCRISAAPNDHDHAHAATTPHAGNPTLHAEHMALLGLVKDADITHTAIRDGAWSDARIWKDTRVPAGDANVLIPKGVSVALDRVEPARLRTVRVDGRFIFAPDRDTALLVDTMIVTPDGELQIGTPALPVAAGKTARITFIDRGPIDTNWDPKRMTRGLISHGAVTIAGATVTPFLALKQPAREGATKLSFAQFPVNWRKGDRILLPGIHAQRSEDEEIVINAIDLGDVTVAPLAHDHTPTKPELPTYAANLTRNVIFDSENTKDIERMGHVMLMHSPKVTITNAAFGHLGRTNKLKPIDDPKMADGKLVADTGSNARGRYAVHLHRTGTNPGDAPVRVQSCVVTDGPGWGFVNHSSNVDFTDNVAFNVAGSAFVTEAGDEIGSFRRNLAVRSAGSGEDEDARRKLQDFGHEGDGFWFQGGGVIVEDNIAAGQASSGFIFFTLGLEQDGLGRMRFAVANLWDKTWDSKIAHVDHKDPDQINDPNSVPVIAVPIRSFKRNTAIACGKGYTSRFLQPQPARSAFEDGLVWNCSLGVHVRYTSNFDLRNLHLVGNAKDKSGNSAIQGTNEGEQHIRYQNLHVEGWSTGLAIPEAGHHIIEGGFYSNARSIVIPTPFQRGRRVDITGDLKFGAVESGAQQDIVMEARFAGLLQGTTGYRDPNVLFVPDVTTLNFGKFKGRQLYYPEQGADAVPFPKQQDPATMKRLGRIEGSVPAELLDKPTRDMARQFGIAIAGAIAPADSVSEPRIHGLIGAPSNYQPEIRPVSNHANRVAGYQFAAIASGGQQAKQSFSDPTPRNLHDGWNLVTTNMQGGVRSFFILAGEVKPQKKPGYDGSELPKGKPNPKDAGPKK